MEYFTMRFLIEEIQNKINEGNNTNIVISPTSMNIILNMAASGSHGKTLEQFLGFLGSKSVAELNSKTSSLMALIDVKDNNRPVVSMENAMFIQQGFTLKRSFQKLVWDFYKTEPISVDFDQLGPLINSVNSWAEKNTNGAIKEFLPPSLRLDPPLLFANATSFKAAWTEQFIPWMTRDEDFHLLDGKTVSVPFMIDHERKTQGYGSFEDFKVLRLFFRRDINSHGQFCMDIILPNRRNGLKDVIIENFNSDEKFLHEDFELEPATISKLWIPKWKFTSDLNATDLMQKLGLTLPFTYPDADFTEMIDSPIGNELFIQKILQKSCIEVNEGGAEAFAATLCNMRGGCSQYSPPQTNFIADHPFIFMIKESVSGTVIFSGAVLNPLLT